MDEIVIFGRIKSEKNVSLPALRVIKKFYKKHFRNHTKQRINI